MLSEGSSVKGSPEDKQASASYVSAKISWRVTLALYTSDLEITDAILQYAFQFFTIG